MNSEEYIKGYSEGLKKAIDLIEDGRTDSILNDREQCSQCLSRLLAELNKYQPDKLKRGE